MDRHSGPALSWRPHGVALFLTWRLHGSLPPGRAFEAGMPGDTRHFDEIDRLLNEIVCGPRWLAEPDIAAAVAAALDYHADTLNHFKLHAWVVMPNHIHALASPLADPAALLQSLKGDTARQANHLLGRPGAPFWDREHHEQWVRNRKEWNQVILRIESDPVRAGLARSPDEYPWSSAARLLPAA